ncbi:4'-phosphopantetheinyl transferase family protein [Anaerosporobacter sp.]|uniref:4'-phosphopantetheinyl transferase family protein n=1 Tax=Anaerosporobacter sp. TaxID=1872529 RepID=UPI00286F3950|nr:4'-phosphopantetheinyl transferase superfamily protein [Anaerosporobacter sp.]
MNTYQYAINTTTVTEDMINRLSPFVSQERRLSADKYKFFIDKARCILGEYLARYALKKHYNLSDNDISFSTSTYGKPFLKDIDNIYFNISHSGNWVVCVVGDEPLGVDVEKIAHTDLHLAERFFTQNEYTRILECAVKDRADEFFKLWTLKESYIKAIGKGLHMSLDSFEFRHIQDKEQLFIDNEPVDCYHFSCRRLDDSHYYALCTTSTTDTIHNLEYTVLDY